MLVPDTLAGGGVEIHRNCTTSKVRLEAGQKVVELVNDCKFATASVDTILTGIGRVPAMQGLNLEVAGVHVDDFLRTCKPRIFTAGDVCLVHQFTNTAETSGRIVVRNALLFGRQSLSGLIIPWRTYTDREVTHVGLYVK